VQSGVLSFQEPKAKFQEPEVGYQCPVSAEDKETLLEALC